ncbi:ABC transporter permease [Mycobacterium sp. MS1601]|uniref:ABC transporter permease n=1 Tax=Mycobacterium sp. MS1601 TaxID=1936029 RepID=UPI00178CC735|nr:ABC transporter permease [Mycobacterium sp. MS1601]
MSKHERSESLLEGLRDAVSPRTLVLGLGVLLLQFAFILSYIGAFHAPTPQHIPVAVVAPAQASQSVVDRLNAIAGQPLDASVAADEESARRALGSAETSAVFLVDPTGSNDRLLIASAGGTSVSGAVEQIFDRVAQSENRTVTVDDVVPLESGDGRGLSGFYLVVGWAVGGYLFASMLGVAKGARPATFPRAIWRLAATIPYSLASGIGGAVVAGPVLGALTGHLWALAGIGTLVALAAATVTMAFQMLFGTLGIALTVLVFVILGNPSAGGAYQPALLPPFWRALHSWLPNGAGTDAVRRIVYFGGDGLAGPVSVLVVWSVAGILLSLGSSALVSRRRARAVARHRHDLHEAQLTPA